MVGFEKGALVKLSDGFIDASILGATERNVVTLLTGLLVAKDGSDVGFIGFTTLMVGTKLGLILGDNVALIWAIDIS